MVRMETFIGISLLAVVAGGQLYLRQVAADFIATLPSHEQKRIREALARSTAA